ncbi:MAG: molybdenum cofactor biosynthesis protein MoaE [Acidobacteriota bacterium]
MCLKPIDTQAVVQQVVRGCVGAVVTFEGVMRDNLQGRRIQHLDYEAYVPMAVKMLCRVATEVHVKFSDMDRLALIHRIGRLLVSETSVLVSGDICPPGSRF